MYTHENAETGLFVQEPDSGEPGGVKCVKILKFVKFVRFVNCVKCVRCSMIYDSTLE